MDIFSLSRNTNGNDDAHAHNATDSEQWQQQLTADLGIGSSIEKGREGQGGGRARGGEGWRSSVGFVGCSRRAVS